MAIYTICAKVTSPKAKVFWSNKMLFQVKYHILCFFAANSANQQYEYKWFCITGLCDVVCGIWFNYCLISLSWVSNRITIVCIPDVQDLVEIPQLTTKKSWKRCIFVRANFISKFNLHKTFEFLSDAGRVEINHIVGIDSTF